MRFFADARGGGRSTRRAGAGPTRVMRRPCLFRGGVPLPSRTTPRPGRETFPAALMGFYPSQCFSCPRVPGRLRPDAPTCRFPEKPTRMIFTGGRPPAHAPTQTMRPAAGFPPRLLGFVPAGNPFPPPFFGARRAETALGFFLSQVFGRRKPGATGRMLIVCSTSLRDRLRSLNARGLRGGVDSAATAIARPACWGRHPLVTSPACPSAYAAGA